MWHKHRESLNRVGLNGFDVASTDVEAVRPIKSVVFRDGCISTLQTNADKSLKSSLSLPSHYRNIESPMLLAKNTSFISPLTIEYFTQAITA